MLDRTTEQGTFDSEGEVGELYVAEHSRVSGEDSAFSGLVPVSECVTRERPSLGKMIRCTIESSAQDQATCKRYRIGAFHLA